MHGLYIPSIVPNMTTSSILLAADVAGIFTARADSLLFVFSCCQHLSACSDDCWVIQILLKHQGSFSQSVKWSLTWKFMQLTLQALQKQAHMKYTVKYTIHLPANGLKCNKSMHSFWMKFGDDLMRNVM